MAAARAYWIASVDENNRPHATPVDGLWMDGELYFGGDPRTRRNRNLAHNPAACVHLESGGDVVILHGEVRELRGMPRELAERLGAASRAKYGYAPSVKEYQESAVQVFRPRVAFAWKQFPQDVTRWTLG
jgi:nitroimidazol reductase NimA-like FMN-containing flavoprotein (pyridoxamine 5'-phosphate oxidase superfamily)